MIKCPECGMEFSSQEEHDKHHMEAHGINVQTGGMKCPMCGFTSQSNEDMEIHTKTHKTST